MASLLERLRDLSPESDRTVPGPDAARRLDLFSVACPLYVRLLGHHPEWFAWLERDDILRSSFWFQKLLAEWIAFRTGHGNPGRGSEAYVSALRRFRRRISMRIAYRDVCGIADQAETVADLTELAEFCARECYFIAREQWDRRLGAPWDEERDSRARFCVLGLGKLGGRELNFSSDIDLIYFFEGEGTTRRNGKPASTDNREYFQRLGETITHLLNTRDGDGFLFRADLRLRPNGAMSPLVPSFEGVESYYAARGQTWERLALIKARPVAGDLDLGAELLETLQSFRYPRHPPPSLLADVAAMKSRTEREVVGDDVLKRDVKSGYGGIREIEFLVQAMQMLRAGRYPFLQTNSTIEALHQLVRYGQMLPGNATFLEEAYWFLRRIEHRVQMADELQTHELPTDPSHRAALAGTLGFSSLQVFDERVSDVRERVRALYATFFKDAAPQAADVLSPWWAFFAYGTLTGPVSEKLQAWFSGDENAIRDLRQLGRGSETQTLLKDQVQRFVDLIPALDRVIPRLARPIATFERLMAFAERYGSRNQFLSACSMNPEFFEVLTLLFDRSVFIHDLLCRHPEILEEVLRPEILRKRKDVGLRIEELRRHPGEPAADFVSWLWLYVRAEQVRAAIGQLLGFLDDFEVEDELSDLAEAVLADVVRRIPGASGIAVVALGTFGGIELSFGSDLDVIFVGNDDAADDKTPIMRAVAKMLSGGPAHEPAFELDLRLRPYGDAGPVVPSVAGFRTYFEKSAQTWERQALTRARVLFGPPEIVAEWHAFVDEAVYGKTLTAADGSNLWLMRRRVERERDSVEPPQRAFKTAAGGLVDIEFGLQILQLRHGSTHRSLRTTNTSDGWNTLARLGLADPHDVRRILENLRHLKRIEWHLRRSENRSVSVLPSSAADKAAFVRWIGGTDWGDFWSDHCARMADTRRLILKALEGLVDSTALETHR